MKRALLVVGSAILSGAAGARDLPVAAVSLTCGKGGVPASVTAEGLVVRDPGSPAGLRALRTALPDRGRLIDVTNAAVSPRSCVGRLIHILQSQGYRRIGFISELPAADRVPAP